MTRGLSPLAARELVASGADEIMFAEAATVIAAVCLIVGWTLPHPMAAWVRHLPVGLAALFSLTALVSALHRAGRVLDERAGGTYETLLLGGASGRRFVAGMVQAGVLRELVALPLMLPAFAACVCALGTPGSTIAAFCVLQTANLVLVNACAVLAGSGRPAGARGSRPAGGSSAPRAGLALHALLPPALSALLLLPAVWFAVRGLPETIGSPALGDALLVPLALCPPAVFALSDLHLGGWAVPFLPFAVLVNLGLAAVAAARAAELHRHHRHDMTRVRRALTFAAHAAALVVLAAALRTPGAAALALVAGCELAALLAIAPDATSPTWPADGPARAAGDLWRERSRTGVAFVALVAASSAPLFAWAAPPGEGRLAALAWLYAAVAGLAWALAAYEPPRPEPAAKPALGLRSVVLLLSATALATVLWDETVVATHSAWMVVPLRTVLGLVALSSPLTGCVGLAAMHGPLPVLGRGNLAGAALAMHVDATSLYWLSLGWHALLGLIWNFRRSR